MNVDWPPYGVLVGFVRGGRTQFLRQGAVRHPRQHTHNVERFGVSRKVGSELENHGDGKIAVMGTETGDLNCIGVA